MTEYYAIISEGIRVGMFQEMEQAQLALIKYVKSGYIQKVKV